MFRSFQLFPEAASTGAVEVDRLYIFLIALTGAAVVLVITLAVYFAVKYRRRADNEVPKYEAENKYLEYAWITLPFIAFMVIYFWSAQVYFRANRPPDDALEVWGTGRRWMWKFQHLGGQSEINQLHVPLGRPVKVILSSEDVIHSFFVPAFRVKRDVLPHRYTTVWFRATKPGTYHLFCAEYCGTEHSKMIGSVVVLPEAEYQTWLAGGKATTPAAEGEQLFSALACNTCHAVDAPGARGPQLGGLFGSQVRLRTGQVVTADENYLRESILNPTAKIVAGYEPIMPTFEGQVDEQQLIYLITYIKSLGAKEQAGGATGAPIAPAQAGSTTTAAPQQTPAPATTAAPNP